MWRAGELSVSFKTSVLGRRGRGEQCKVLKQRAEVARSLVALKLVLSPSWSQAPRRVRSEGTGCTAWGGTESRPNYLSLTPCVLILASRSLGSLDAQAFPTYAS